MKYKIYTREEYELALENEKALVNVCFAAIVYLVGLGLLWMGLL